MSGRMVGWVMAAVAVPALVAAVGLAWVRPPAEPAAAVAPAPQTTAGPSVAPEPASTATSGVAARVAAVVAADPLLFDGERADLRPATAAVVDRLAEILVAAPEASVRLVGHTADLPGPPVRAQALSRERAEAVAARLVARGIDRARIGVDGVGDGQPLGTPEASRRVDVLVG